MVLESGFVGCATNYHLQPPPTWAVPGRRHPIHPSGVFAHALGLRTIHTPHA